MTQDEDFAALFEAQAKRPRGGGQRLRPGQTIEGTVIAIDSDTVFVDVGTRTEARLPRTDVTNDKGTLTVAVGDRLAATVAQADDRGPTLLRKTLGGGPLDTEQLTLAVSSGLPVEGEFAAAVKGGLEVTLGEIRAFCPASQVDLAYVADLTHLVGQRHFFKVLEVRDRGRSVIVSRKALLLDERDQKAAELLQRIHVGDELDGIVQSIQAYGAFVDLGGVLGLVHVSEVSHGRVGSPGDLVSIGEKVRVKVLGIEQKGDGPPRISLSMKAMVQASASETETEDTKGEVYVATVTKVENFGVLVTTPIGNGLIPTAELGIPRGSDPRRTFKLGGEVEVVLQRRDGNGSLRFSARAVRDVEEREAFRSFASQQRKQNATSEVMRSLGDLLKGIKLPDGPSAPAPIRAPAERSPPPSRESTKVAPTQATPAIEHHDNRSSRSVKEDPNRTKRRVVR